MKLLEWLAAVALLHWLTCVLTGVILQELTAGTMS